MFVVKPGKVLTFNAIREVAWARPDLLGVTFERRWMGDRRVQQRLGHVERRKSQRRSASVDGDWLRRGFVLSSAAGSQGASAPATAPRREAARRPMVEAPSGPIPEVAAVIPLVIAPAEAIAGSTNTGRRADEVIRAVPAAVESTPVAVRGIAPIPDQSRPDDEVTEPSPVTTVSAAALATEFDEPEVSTIDDERARMGAAADVVSAADQGAPTHGTIEPVAVESMVADAAPEWGELEVRAVDTEPAPVATTADIGFAADAAALQPAHATIEPVTVEPRAVDAASESGEVEVHAVAAEPDPGATTADVDSAAAERRAAAGPRHDRAGRGPGGGG